MNRKNLAHIWAQQTKAHGRASNLYFEGATIYSYGSHFPIARFIENAKGRAVLFTTRTHSVSTSAHISAARGALCGLGVPVFHVQDPTAAVRTEVRMDYEARISELAEKAARSRKYGEMIIGQARELAKEANTAAQFFGFRWRLALPELSAESLAKIRETIAKRTKAQRAKEAKRAKAKLAEYNTRCAEWRAGKDVSTHAAGLGVAPDTMLRVKGDIVQTSRGAEVPADHARRIWPIIQRVVRTGQAYKRNGHTEHIGAFAVDAIDVDGTMRAGCHTIKYAELQRCAAALGCAV